MSVLFPTGYKCIICGEEIPKGKFDICERCYPTLPFIKDDVCVKCGKPLNITGVCISCKNDLPVYEKCFAVFEFKPPIDNLIYRLKYDGELYLYKTLSRLLLQKLMDSKVDFDVVMPVPLHHNRECKRGFNQAKELVKEFCKLGVSVDNTTLIRVKDTISQTHLSRDERQENMEDAFKVLVKSRVKGKKIVLVDDVFTTGATFNSIAKVLYKNGALKVYGLGLGHAVFESK